MSADRATCDVLCLDLAKAEEARRRLPAATELEAWAAGAKALGDPTRLAVAVALAESGTACVCDLAWVVGRHEKLVSHHARALRSAGLTSSSRQGKLVMYELTDRGAALLAAVAGRERASA